MSKVRINDLARELEVKSQSILDALTAVGATEKKTHSSSIEADEAEKVRDYLSGHAWRSAATKPPAEAKPAFNLSNISKPGDAVKAILARKQAEEEARNATTAAASPRPWPLQQKLRPSRAPRSPSRSCRRAAPAAPAPRRVVPQPRQQAQIVTPAAPPPAIASKPPVGPVIARPPVVVAPPPSPMQHRHSRRQPPSHPQLRPMHTLRRTVRRRRRLRWKLQRHPRLSSV